MQRIYRSPWTVEEYIATEAHRQIVPESSCPGCRNAVHLHRHARYQRWLVTVLAQYVLIWVARFWCPLCHITISYLPDFVATYRPTQWESLEAFLEGRMDRPDVYRFVERLQAYRREAENFCPELFRTVGSGLGRAPPRTARGLWEWLKKAGDGLRAITRKLVTDFKISLFKRYRCHQPAP